MASAQDSYFPNSKVSCDVNISKSVNDKKSEETSCEWDNFIVKESPPDGHCLLYSVVCGINHQNRNPIKKRISLN